MAYEVILNWAEAYRVILEERKEGVYINVFNSVGANKPSSDKLFPDLQGAIIDCLEEFGIQEDQWKVVPNEPWHAPAVEKSGGP